MRVVVSGTVVVLLIIIITRYYTLKLYHSDSLLSEEGSMRARHNKTLTPGTTLKYMYLKYDNTNEI